MVWDRAVVFMKIIITRALSSPANSFKFHSCERTPQAADLTPSLRHCNHPKWLQRLVRIIYCRDYSRHNQDYFGMCSRVISELKVHLNHLLSQQHFAEQKRKKTHFWFGTQLISNPICSPGLRVSRSDVFWPSALTNLFLTEFW